MCNTIIMFLLLLVISPINNTRALQQQITSNRILITTKKKYTHAHTYVACVYVCVCIYRYRIRLIIGFNQLARCWVLTFILCRFSWHQLLWKRIICHKKGEKKYKKQKKPNERNKFISFIGTKNAELTADWVVVLSLYVLSLMCVGI